MPRGEPLGPDARKDRCPNGRRYLASQFIHEEKGYDVTPTATAERSKTEQAVHDLEQDIEREENEAAYQREQGREDQAQAHDAEAEASRAKLNALKDEAGDATGEGDPAAEAATNAMRDAEADRPPPEEIIVSGIEMPYADLGGKKPTGGTLSLSGGKIMLEQGTAFSKGQTITGSFVAVVKDVGQVDTHDAATQQVVSSEQRHVARITDLIVEVPE